MSNDGEHDEGHDEQCAEGLNQTQGTPESCDGEEIMRIENVLLTVLLAIVAFFLWTEHRAHVMGVLPYLIFLLCPLIHLFMHRRYGNQNGQGGHH